MATGDTDAVVSYLAGLQDAICDAAQTLDGAARFVSDTWRRPEGRGDSRILAAGDLFEKAGVNFSHVRGARLPAAASASRPELAGGAFEAAGVSLVFHPRNPYVPTAHCNVRFFSLARADDEPLWWFGGGYDLTPCYPFLEDVLHWHRTARAACAPFGDDVYPRFKAWCDDYFYLRHRDETRGVGGLFFDDLNDWGFARCFAFLRSVGDSFIPAYRPVAERRRDAPFGEREREFQLYRRGRYVEFNLVYDRGTLFGLQSGGRAESILMSLPPHAKWRYGWKPQAGSPEEELHRDYLKPKNWLAAE